MKPQHGHIIITESYFQGTLSSTKQEYEVSLFSTKEGILKDVIEALSVISNGETHKLNMDICIDSQGRYRLVKKWVA